MLSTLIFTNLFLLKTSTSPCLSKKCIFVLPFNVPSSKFENVSFSISLPVQYPNVFFPKTAVKILPPGFKI